MKEKFYNTPKYFLNPNHAVSLDLVGTGGTGSHVLMGLACINNALLAFGHAGLDVTAWDDDKVESHNVGRQYFGAPDVGFHKSTALITRINRMYGFKWTAKTIRYMPQTGTNIVVSCVDSIKSRKEVYLHLKHKKKSNNSTEDKYFWIDVGNSKDSGQIIIGSFVNKIPLPNFFERFPNVKDTGEDVPSCSMAQALQKQDLQINQAMALHLNSMIWRMFRSGKIESAGMYVNHKLYQTSSIPI